MERDFPVGHPAASDYNGEPYNPPRAPYGEDFAEGHPARGGANISDLDRPDGLRAALLAQKPDLEELAAIGALPPIMDDATGQPVPFTSLQLVRAYALKCGLLAAPDVGDVTSLVVDNLMEHGYVRERAEAVLRNYCTAPAAK